MIRIARSRKITEIKMWRDIERSRFESSGLIRRTSDAKNTFSGSGIGSRDPVPPLEFPRTIRHLTWLSLFLRIDSSVYFHHRIETALDLPLKYISLKTGTWPIWLKLGKKCPLKNVRIEKLISNPKIISNIKSIETIAVVEKSFLAAGSFVRAPPPAIN